MAGKTVAVIVAGGLGTRMNNNLPKQFLELGGKPLLLHTIEAFIRGIPGLTIVMVVHPEHRERAASIAGALPSTIDWMIADGGATRFQSVKAGLTKVAGDDLVLIHDAVRCLITPGLIVSCLEAARRSGNAIPAITCRESVRLVDGQASRIVDRDTVRLVQTPQVFLGRQIKQAYDQATHGDFTDDASVLEAAGFPVHLTDGEDTNIKITRPADLLVAEAILRDRLSAER